MSYWIYHERQSALLCGQHALNNLLQANIFTPGDLSDIAHQLDQMELAYMSQNNEGGIHSKDYLKRVAEGSGNVDESGNFSIEVLRSALMTRYNLELPNLLQSTIKSQEITSHEGFICNRSSHWFAIRNINGRFWNLNSTNEMPELISHFRLAAEMEGLMNEGWSVFCVAGGSLPGACSDEAMMDRGMPEYWWKESDLLEGKTNAMTRNDDPWKDVGSGRRLDGKPKSESNGKRPIHELSEDEQLEAAIRASMMDCNDNNANPSSNSFDQEILSMSVGEEPASGARVQIRMPDGKKLIRNFNGDDPVKVIYAFVAQSSSEAKGGKSFGLKAKFPPVDLLPSVDESILSCGLSGEAINVTWNYARS